MSDAEKFDLLFERFERWVRTFQSPLVIAYRYFVVICANGARLGHH